jgi:flagellar biosynthetic protein FliR
MSFSLHFADAFKMILVLLRVSSLFAVLPVFGLKSVPAKFKIIAGAALSLVVASGLPDTGNLVVHSNFQMVFLAVREVVIGLSLGFIASFIFRAVEFGGEIIGTQMGFAIANVYDPITERQMSVISNFQRALFILLFFTINGHHILFGAVFRSCEVLPVGGGGLDFIAVREILRLGGNIFSVAVQIASPAIIMLLLTHLAIGVISRTVPQMNVFIISFPLTIFVGVFMLAITMPAFVTILQTLVGNLSRDLAVVIKAFA